MFLISLNEWSFAIVIHIYFKKDYNKKVVVKKKTPFGYIAQRCHHAPPVLHL